MTRKIVVLYQSQYGFTKRYAELIAKEVGVQAVEVGAFDFSSDYDVLVFGGGLYAGQVNGLKTLLAHQEEIQHKKLILFTVGLADPADELVQKNVTGSVKKQMPEGMYDGIRHFLLQGGIDYTKLTFIHKSMMWMLKAVLSLKKNKTDSDRAVIEGYGKNADLVSEDSIKPLLDSLAEA